MLNNHSKTCLITGAAGDIGMALADHFTNNGYKVIATDINPSYKEINCAHYVQCDLFQFSKDEIYAEQIIKEISMSLGNCGLNVLVNNAAIQILGDPQDLGRVEWDKVININVLAPFFLIEGFLPELAKVKGSIINIGSIHSKLTKKKFAAYSTSKAALSALSRALAIEYGSQVRVNTIEPAAIMTKMLLEGFKFNDEKISHLKKCHPAGGIGGVDEIAKVALFLAREDVSFIHGATISVDGGIGARLYDPE